MYSGALHWSLNWNTEINSMLYTLILLKKINFTVLEILEKEESAEEFKRPVDKEEAADYYKVIEKPMWLDRMKRKVKDCCYRTPEMVYII